MEQSPTISEVFPIPAEAKRLEVFLGDWDVEGTVTFGGNAMKAKGRWAFRKAAGGWGLKATMKVNLEGMGSYEEDDLVGFDKESGRLHVFTLTNTAAVHDHLATWSDRNTLNLEYDGLQDGKKLREEATIRFSRPNELTMSEVDTVDGQVASTMEVTLRK